MKMKKLSVKALMSLILSAILFCMPIGAFFANRANTVEVHAEDTAEQKTESAAEESSAESTASGNDNKDSSGSGENHTEQSTENTTENSTEAQPRKHSLLQNAPARKNAVSMRWMRIVRCVQRITRNVLISIRA